MECVAGMRRYYAAKELGWETIEGYSRELTDLEAVKIAFSENIKRENLNPIELGKMYRTYMDYLPRTYKKDSKTLQKSESILRDQVAKTFQISEKSVRDYISLLSLPKELQDLIISNHENRKKGFEVYFGIELILLSC